MKPWRAQLVAELRMTARRGDSVLLNLGIPVGLLVFFSVVNVLPLPAGVHHPVQFLTPGVMALAVMSTSMVSLGISTGFERQYGVLKRLAVTPLGRGRLLAAKMASTALLEVVQVALLAAVGLALGWTPGGGWGWAVLALLVATIAFSGLGLLMAGSLRAEATLAAANGLYLALLLLGGMVFPLTKLPAALRDVAQALPAAALSDALHGALASGGAIAARDWIVLGAWTVAGPVAAALAFRWE
jgi:ABC-2 type transport system permease protein